jgi:hypothetical protein
VVGQHEGVPVTARRRATRGRREERGLALIFTVMLLVVMLIFASFAIDIGALYNHRRQDQNAADSGALAAAQDLTSPAATMRDSAMQWAEDTVGVDFPLSMWNTCGSDGGALANAAPGANCITYTSDRVRVRLPDQHYDTVFGGVVGADSFRHSAFAIAGLASAGFGGVLPFGVQGPNAQGGYGCLQSNSNGQASEVCGSVSGNFRFLDFNTFGGTEARPFADCGQGAGDVDERIRHNSAMGIDHTISIFGTTHLLDINDRPACQASPQIQRPNNVDTRTGNQAGDATTGLFSGGAGDFPDGQPARLRRSDPYLFNGSAPARVTVAGTSNLDNVPLWRFIPPNYGPGRSNPADIPESCLRNQFVDSSDNPTNVNLPAAVAAHVAGLNAGDRVLVLLQRCFDHYMGVDWSGFPLNTSLSPPEPPAGCSGPCDDPIFALNSTTTDEPDLYDIQYTPRFGYVPELQDWPSGGSTPARIVDFHAVYIQRLLLEMSGNSTIVWDAGVSAPPGGSLQRLGETTIFVFPDGSLPNGLAEGDAPFQVGVNRFVRLVR